MCVTQMTISDFDDDDIDEEKVLQISFDTASRAKYASFWAFLDYCFDKGVRNHMLINVQEYFHAAESFCYQQGIDEDEIPLLYREMFEAKDSFLGQVKMPFYYKYAWLSHFPHPLMPLAQNGDCDILFRFKEFLESQEKQYSLTLACLLQYLKDI